MAKVREFNNEIVVPAHLPVIDYSQIEIINVIGVGGFGKVSKAKWQQMEVAVKQLLLTSDSLGNELSEDFLNEALAMSKCRHPCIVNFFGISVTQEFNFLIVMEFMSRGSLLQNLQDAALQIPWHVRMNICSDISNGLAYLHSQNILHRDLKSRNIVLDNSWKAKITDFGLAKVKTAISTTTTKTSTAGTVRWSAPELFKRGQVKTKKSDVWALGMVLWEVTSRKIPFAEVEDELIVISFIKDGETEAIAEDVPSSLGQAIEACWIREPEERPESSEIYTLLSEAIEMEELKDKEEIERVSKSEFRFRASTSALPSYLFPSINWKAYNALKTALIDECNMSLNFSEIVPNIPLKTRAFHTGTTVGNKIFYIGGGSGKDGDGSRRHNDVLCYHVETNKFEHIKTKGKAPHVGKHAVAMINELIYVFGGHDGVAKFHQLSTFNTKKYKWKSVKTTGNVPGSRSNHRIVAVGEKIYLLGGANGLSFFCSADLYVLDTKTKIWSSPKLTGEKIAPRSCFVMHAFNEKIVLYGGCEKEWAGKSKCSEAYVIDTEKLHVTKFPIAPLDSSIATTTTVIGPFILSFGGQVRVLSDPNNSFDCIDTAIAMDTISMKWTQLKIQAEKLKRSWAVANLANDTIVISHGYKNEPLNDVFELKMSNNCKKALEEWNRCSIAT